MKGSVGIALLLIAIFFVPSVTSLRQIGQPNSHHGHHHYGIITNPEVYWERVQGVMKRKGAETLQIAGSSLPDCSHACGSCSPCRLVMVSFVCASLEEAETCPMAYKCMCNNKSYPVP
ncbi:protein EPIDERMAL PATTERNING FACTOR 1-like [Mangifera indica]|uniref:protein EPIDERMAL PATTERNING FACTOR 1-like n=1 Tax=Mangifera indica TaxID=29780 RepID=UPI001CFB02AE|nr:protein EPIDERMAL PATTERNING FACTOR 1-like [Mangifera indica]